MQFRPELIRPLKGNETAAGTSLLARKKSKSYVVKHLGGPRGEEGQAAARS